jgi:hypothetical protein
MKSKAILFGIDYLTSPSPLRGCSNDVKNMSSYLQAHLGYDSVKTYTEQDNPTKVTTQGIIRLMYKLAIDSWSLQLDRALIHFSGHGTAILDRNGDERDGKDEAICPVDYASSGVISDDILLRLFRYFNPATRLVCVFDCCHSGTVGDLQYSLSETNVQQIENQKTCPGNVVMISGCQDHQTSADAFNVSGRAQFSGAMTSCLLDCVRYRRMLSGTVSARTLVNDVQQLLRKKGFSQVPVLTSSREMTDDTVIF